jgi:hypothetical protein
VGSKSLRALCASLVLAQFCLPAKHAFAITPIATFQPTGGGQVDRFARFMSVDGNQVLVGAGDGGYLFQRTNAGGTAWQQIDYVRSTADPFGAPVALRGNVAIFGAEDNGPAGQQSGSATILQRSASNLPFFPMQALSPADAEMFDQFGHSVALGNGFAVVGADNDGSKGSVTIFNQSPPFGNFFEVKKFAGSDVGLGDGFGEHVAVSGETLVVSGRGSPYVFEQNRGGANNWGEVKKLDFPLVPGGAWDIAIDGDFVLASSRGLINKGRAVVFGRNQGGLDNWGQVTELTNPIAGSEQDGFGYSVALKGDLAVVGQSLGDTEHGHAYVYGRNVGGVDQWGLLAHLDAGDPDLATYFGTSVGIMDNLVLVGTLGFPTGAVSVFSVPEPSGAMILAGALVCGIVARARCNLWRRA